MEGIQKDNKACLKFQACFTSKIAILNIEPSSSPISFDWQWLRNQSQTSFSKIIKNRIPGQNEFHELSDKFSNIGSSLKTTDRREDKNYSNM